MSLLNRILFFSLLTVLLSCAPHKKDYRNKKQASERLFNAALFDLFSKTIEEYKQVVETLKEEKDIYNEMISLSYEANRIHNEIVERQELGLLALENLEMHIIDLEEMLFNTAAPLPEEIVEKLDAIWLDLQTMKDLINEEEMDDEKIDIIEDLEDYTDFLEMEYDPEAVFSDEEMGSDLESAVASEPAGESELVSSDEEVGLDTEDVTASEPAEESEAVSSDEEVGLDTEDVTASEPVEESEAVSSDEEVGLDTEDVTASEPAEESEAVSSEEVGSDVESAAASEPAEESEAVSSEEVGSDVESAAASEPAEESEAVSSEEVGSDVESAAASEPVEESEAFS